MWQLEARSARLASAVFAAGAVAAGLLSGGATAGTTAGTTAVPTAVPTAAHFDVTAAVSALGQGDRLKPRMKRKFIPFGNRRKLQMARYSKRHYGEHRYRLRNPRVIVEHYTDGPTMMSAWWTMANNTKNLGEFPGVCTHFIIGKQGRIYRIVSLELRCRHTIGLNQTAIGIEHVGSSDAGVMGRDAQRKASYRLTLWLMAKFDIPVKNVIGHAESLMSPLRYEKYRSWRCNTHSDFSHRTMKRYRAAMRDRARAHNVRVGGEPHWVDIGC